MTKYSAELKIEIAQEYLSGRYSYIDLLKHHQMPKSSHAHIRYWVALAKFHGLEELRLRQTHRTFSTAEKLAMVDYYQTHDEGSVVVAARFKISPSQVVSWTRIFNQEGAAGLRPRPKGRKPIMNKQKPTANEDKLEPTEKEALIQENIRLKQALYEAQMELDIRKKLRAVSKNNQMLKKQK